MFRAAENANKNTSPSQKEQNICFYSTLTVTLQLIVTTIGGVTSHKFKKMTLKKNMLISSCGVFLSMVSLTICYYYQASNLPILFGNISFQVFFCFGLGPTTWTYAALVCEKNSQMMSAVVINNLCAFMIIYSFLPMVENQVLGYAGTFMIYAVLSFVYLIFLVLAELPESSS